MKALNDYLLLRVKEPKDKTVSGIIVKQDPVNYFKGKVLSVGEKLNKDMLGKSVYFNSNATRISIREEEDVLVVIKAEHALLEE